MGVVVIAALVVVREYVDWSGRRRWAAVQEMLAREGESLDFRKNLPDPVPDELNFCAISALKNIAIAPENNDDKSELGRKRMRLRNAALRDPRMNNSMDSLAKLSKVLATGTHSAQEFEAVTKGYIPQPKPSQGANLGIAVDMKAWADWLRTDDSPPSSGNAARDVLAALSKNDSLISELALGLSRPGSQWTPAWKTRELPPFLFSIALPQYSAIQGLTPMLILRSAAAARVGDAAKAHECLLIAIRLNEANLGEPFLIGTLVSCGCTYMISNAVWELCNAHSGTAEDFRRLQEGLSRFDCQKSFLYAERGELAGGVNAAEFLKRTKDAGLVLGPFASPQVIRNVSIALHFIPEGWFDANTATLAQWDFDYFIKPLRDAGLPELLAKRKELETLVTGHTNQLPYRHLDEIVALTAIRVASSVTSKVVYTQCLVNEAIAACALERYRIEHGSYPDTLEAVNRAGERRIPLDVISEKAMGYRKTADGRYALWCVGFDGKDDGGKRVLDKDNPERTRFSDPKYVGDWVWDFAGK
jgi:hypothetical protein